MNDFIEIILEPWKNIYYFSNLLRPFIFRGQANIDWNLKTALERKMAQFQPLIKSSYNKEYWMLNEFKRKFHLYSSNAPKETDEFEWLAIMQHHGSPTRLLDFTHSIFIAAYFALIDTAKDSVIWAINNWRLRDELREKFDLYHNDGSTLQDSINRFHIKFANKLILHKRANSPTHFVIPLESQRLTERISRQQGLFVMPTNLDVSFMQNLLATYGRNDEGNKGFERIKIEDIEINSFTKLLDYYSVIKLIIPKKEHDIALMDLKKMNITSETLFPGLDGFAQSLTHIVIRAQ